MPDTINLMPGGLRERDLRNGIKHRHKDSHQVGYTHSHGRLHTHPDGVDSPWQTQLRC